MPEAALAQACCFRCWGDKTRSRKSSLCNTSVQVMLRKNNDFPKLCAIVTAALCQVTCHCVDSLPGFLCFFCIHTSVAVEAWSVPPYIFTSYLPHITSLEGINFLCVSCEFSTEREGIRGKLSGMKDVPMFHQIDVEAVILWCKLLLKNTMFGLETGKNWFGPRAPCVCDTLE